MRIDLSDKTAIVTGSTAGIGFATAKGLANAGATVVVNGRAADGVEQAVTSLRAELPTATFRGVAADVATRQGCAALTEREPSIDILVNNVGIFGPQDFFEVSDDEWMRFLETNVLSGVRLSRAYLPGMIERGWGRVVFVSSESALNIPADMLHYGTTKTANLGVARGLAKRVSGTGVTVNSVLPGPTLSRGVSAMLEASAAENGQTLEEAGVSFVKANRPTSILQRPAAAEESANMIVYACSPQASATTGAALRVEGGIVDTIS